MGPRQRSFSRRIALALRLRSRRHRSAAGVSHREIPQMDEWLLRGCDYIASWLEFQMRLSRLPGCIAVVMHCDQIALERAYGFADLAGGEPLTPRHRFRIASHSKSFTAAGIMKLREAGKLRLDDAVGEYVKGLHPQ